MAIGAAAALADVRGTLLGGILGAGVGAVVVAKPLKLDGFAVLDAIAESILIGSAIARLSCFAAGCCHGTVTAVWWGVHLDHARGAASPASMPVHPTQLYESFSYFLGALVVRSRGVSTLCRTPGVKFALVLAHVAVVRFIVQFWRADADLDGAMLGRAHIVALLMLTAAMILIVGRAYSTIGDGATAAKGNALASRRAASP
jgi:phosphatidylglycerol:prolipoprotein diacylglycerol transferase